MTHLYLLNKAPIINTNWTDTFSYYTSEFSRKLIEDRVFRISMVILGTFMAYSILVNIAFWETRTVRELSKQKPHGKEGKRKIKRTGFSRISRSKQPLKRSRTPNKKKRLKITQLETSNKSSSSKLFQEQKSSSSSPSRKKENSRVPLNSRSNSSAEFNSPTKTFTSQVEGSIMERDIDEIKDFLIRTDTSQEKHSERIEKLLKHARSEAKKSQIYRVASPERNPRAFLDDIMGNNFATHLTSQNQNFEKAILKMVQRSNKYMATVTKIKVAALQKFIPETHEIYDYITNFELGASNLKSEVRVFLDAVLEDADNKRDFNNQAFEALNKRIITFNALCRSLKNKVDDYSTKDENDSF